MWRIRAVLQYTYTHRLRSRWLFLDEKATWRKGFEVQQLVNRYIRQLWAEQIGVFLWKSDQERIACIVNAFTKTEKHRGRKPLKTIDERNAFF
jgi:hypothetical protein